MIVDAHTHIFPPEVNSRREKYCELDDWFQLLYSNPDSKLATDDDLLQSMETSGIDHSIVCGFPWRDPGLCNHHNHFMADACARSDGRLSWMAIVKPSEPLTRLPAGAVGIGELNADAQGWRDDFHVLTEVAEYAEASELPILLHASEPVGHGYLGKGTATPDWLLELITAFPNNRFCLAHWGGGLPFYELMPEVGTRTAHMVYDSAATTYLYDFNVFRIVIDLVGDNRVLFASDYPVLGQKRLRERLDQMVWRDEQEERRVMGENAIEFYKLGLAGSNK